jgi:hypothetical protein
VLPVTGRVQARSSSSGAEAGTTPKIRPASNEGHGLAPALASGPTFISLPRRSPGAEHVTGRGQLVRQRVTVALEHQPGVARNGNFFYISAASRDYGLAEGTRETAEIALTDLGRRAVYPESVSEQSQALVDAFLNVDAFRKVLNHYGGTNLPERPFLENTLQQSFGVAPEFYDEFVDIFIKNCRFLGIGANFVPWARAMDQQWRLARKVAL